MAILDLHHLYVDDQSRCSGVGRALVAEVAKWADQEGCHRIRLGVSPDNALGIAFYRRLGLREKLPNFYADRDDFSLLANGSKLRQQP
jgi:ribosomal protein S18 acetylase RimI-like enzyme